MGRDLSEDCFWDRCRDCTWPGCTCKCHRDQEFDWEKGWRDKTSDSSDESGRS